MNIDTLDEEKLILEYFYEKKGYHKRILAISCLIWGLLDIFSLTLGLLELKPIIEIIDDSGVVSYKGPLQYEYCNSNFTILDYSKNSLVNYFEIYCNKYLVALIGSVNFLGVLIATLIAPFIIDNYGRKYPTIICLCIYPILLSASTYVQNIYWMYFFIFFCGFTNLISNIAIFLLLNELIIKHKRSKYSATVFNSFAMFGIIFTWSFYFLKDWRYVFYLTSVLTGVLLIFTILFLKESPRYLLFKQDEKFKLKILNKIYERENKDILCLEKNDKIDECHYKLLELENNYEQIDKQCLVGLPEEKLSRKLNQDDSYIKAKAIAVADLNIETIEEEGEDELRISNTSYGVKKYKKVFLIMCFMWFCISGCYYGILILIKDIKGDIYQTYTVMYLLEILSNFIAAFMIETEHYGRKKSMTILYGLGLIIICIFMISNLEDFRSVFYVSFRFVISIIYLIIYIYSTEIYPTDIRAKGLAFNAVCGRLSSIFIPFLVEFLGDKFLIYCLILFAIGFVLSFFLKETYGLELKQSSAE